MCHRWHGTLVLYAVMALAVCVSTFRASRLCTVDNAISLFHILEFFGILIPMVNLAQYNSAVDVFGEFSNDEGWSSEGLSVCVSWDPSLTPYLSSVRLRSMWAQGADGAAHMGK